MMTKSKILEIKDVLIKHEVRKYFDYNPVDSFRGMPVVEVLIEVVESVTEEVMLVLDQLNGSVSAIERLDTRNSVAEEVANLVKIAIVDCMLLFDCLLEINYNE